MTAVARTDLQIMADKIGDLPLLPQVLVSILQLRVDADNYFEEFGKLTKQDPAFAIKLIALANSASSAPAVPVVSIRDALSRIGARALRNLVASLAVQRVFLPTKPNEVRLWQHSVYAAFAAAQIAESAPDLEVDPADAYLVGLLHDIGRFVMFEHAAPDLLKVDESRWGTHEQLIEADIEVFKFTHSELGGKACEHWQLPKLICDVVRLHHTPVETNIVPGSIEALLFCVQVADSLCLALLERDDFAEISADEREQRILADCIRPDRHAKLVSAKMIAAKLDAIRGDSLELVSGLGFV